MKINRAFVTGCLLAITFIAISTQATTFVRMDNARMAIVADVIVVGRCASASSQWIGGTLLTLVNVEIDETLKGAVQDKLTLVIPGGVDPNRSVPVAVIFPGAPTVSPDEKVVLFLSDSNAVNGGFDIVGFNQGKFTVFEDPSGGVLVRKNAMGAAVALDSMKAQIQEALKQED